MFSRGNRIRIEGIQTTASKASEETIAITIPSQFYPLSGTPEIFHFSNTEECTDEQIRSIFDSTEAALGFCYRNTEALASNLKAAGISKKQYQTYAGWLLIGSEPPIHHAFTVIEHKYILDFSVSKHIRELESELVRKDLSREQIREELVKEFIRENSLPHSQRATCGQVPPGYIYIASPCNPSRARKTYQRLARSYPNHPSIKNVASGLTPMQQEILKAQLGG